MTRPIPTVAAPQWSEPSLDESITLHLRLITPLFGGGYEPREVDPVCIIRPATIRGHLRFWWRALYGGQYTSSQQLFYAEAAIWGAAATEDRPSVGKVGLRIQDVKWNKQVKTVNDFRPRGGSPARVGPQAQYLLYTFQEVKKEQTPAAEGYDGVEFTLQVTISKGLSAEHRQQVENTLKAWIAFGGLGARTRRGCGALTVTQDQSHWLPPADAEKRKAWFSRLLPQGAPPKPVHLSVLSGARIVCGNPQSDAIAVLYDLGSFWARFRKGHVGSKQYTPMSGSRWGDYRQALLQFQKRNQGQIALSKPFLGLPIVYQSFKNAPYAPTIESAETGRMASPVILKPLALASGQVCPLCMVLEAPVPKEVRIKPPDTVVRLAVPQDDEVLKDLQVRHPLEAVIKAAEIQWKTKAFGIGGA
ncbi:MAG: type III-B CRISPR module RAMP protein Cmr1 [Armatimonadota bacterium]|nr:type III-B CRISPR module RAMP protein Cmr1 [Armatimonadota bacterium]